MPLVDRAYRRKGLNAFDKKERKTLYNEYRLQLKYVPLETSFAEKHLTIMSLIKLYSEEIRLMSEKDIMQERKRLNKVISGDAFFSQKSWPRDIRLIY